MMRLIVYLAMVMVVAAGCGGLPLPVSTSE